MGKPKSSEIDREAETLVKNLVEFIECTTDESLKAVAANFDFDSERFQELISSSLMMAAGMGGYDRRLLEFQQLIEVLQQKEVLSWLAEADAESTGYNAVLMRITQRLRSSTPEETNYGAAVLAIDLHKILRELKIGRPEALRETDQGDVLVDDFLDDPLLFHRRPELSYAHFILSHYRSPAWIKMLHGPWFAERQLFMTFEGERWQVVMASRLGDIGITRDPIQGRAYQRRVKINLKTMTDWSGSPFK